MVMIRLEIHPSITIERVAAAVRRRFSSSADPGFCIACGADADGCEPDARGYECKVCGKPAVYGDEALLIEMSW
jgi:predicted amidophosphoribosyltransferase